MDLDRSIDDLTIICKNRELANVYWRINDLEEKVNELEITLKPKLNGIFPNIPRIFRWLPYFIFVRWQMKNYLTHVLNGFESYITKDIKVKPNQFGKHRFYSKK